MTARHTYPPAEWIADASATESDAEGYAKVETENHRMGGYWFPVAEEPEDAGGFVAGKGEIPAEDLIQFPRDEQPPVMGDGSEPPEWVNDRHVDASLSLPEADE